MEAQDQRRIVGNHQHVRRDRDSLRRELRDFGDEMVRIDHHTIADNREFAADDPRRQQRQLVADPVDDQRMAGIVAALVAHHHVGALAQPVDDLALALVTPLAADDDHICHVRSLAPHALGRV